MITRISYLYINGLGTGKPKLIEKLVFWWWRQAKLDIHHANINWFDSQPFETKLQQVNTRVTELLEIADRVVLIGSSAGGSLAINAFHEFHNRNVYAVNVRGRLGVGKYPKGNWYSLDRRAYLDTDRPSQSFYDSVQHCEKQVLPHLTATDRQRLLVLTQLTDMVVPLGTMTIPGVKQHRSLAFGHSGGFLAHMIASRGRISDFATIKS